MAAAAETETPGIRSKWSRALPATPPRTGSWSAAAQERRSIPRGQPDHLNHASDCMPAALSQLSRCRISQLRQKLTCTFAPDAPHALQTAASTYRTHVHVRSMPLWVERRSQMWTSSGRRRQRNPVRVRSGPATVTRAVRHPAIDREVRTSAVAGRCRIPRTPARPSMPRAWIPAGRV